LLLEKRTLKFTLHSSACLSMVRLGVQDFCRLTFRVTLSAILFFVAGLLACAANAAPTDRVVLSKSTSSAEAWPVTTMAADESGELGINDVMAGKLRFLKPDSAYATLGMRNVVKWLRIPVRVSADVPTDGGADSLWIFDVDYALLNRVDVYVVRDGPEGKRIESHVVLGNAQLFEEKPIASRAHAVALHLKPATEIEVFMRVETMGAMILPITFSTLSAFHQGESGEQMLQGLFAAIALGLLFYSLLQWRSLKESLYLKYAVLVFFSGIFSVHFFGIGEQYLWTDQDWIARHLAGISSLVAAAATAFFVEDVLRRELGSWMRRALRAVGILLLLAAVAHGMDVLSIRGVGVIMNTIGYAPSLLGVPAAIRIWRRGDAVGAYFIVAWVGYAIASAIMVGMVLGRVDATFWTMHSFQIGATLDMLIFMRIAVMRSAAVHVEARRATRERDSLITMAHSDPLTGLFNRRGLNELLPPMVSNIAPNENLAVFLLDLDGFKPVNDLFGHDVGDELLVLVGTRLRNVVRTNDLVARVGGDEFVVVAGGLGGDDSARDLGQKLLTSICQPYQLKSHICEVGVTIGYALVPEDGRDAKTLLKVADAAMYIGKQTGKNRLERGTGLHAVRKPGKPARVA
jgi:diguanylate cyclase